MRMFGARFQRAVFSLAAMAAGLLVLCAPLHRAAAMSITPPVFEFVMNPGETLTESVRVTNDGADPLRIEAELANFTNKSGDESSGAPELYPADETRDAHGLAPWMKIISSPAAIASGEQANLIFEVRVPEHGDAGSKFGAIVLHAKGKTETSGVGVIGNVAALVIVRVNGDVVEEMSVTSFEPDHASYSRLPAHFSARVENTGSVHLRPHGTVTITDLFGRVAAVLPVNIESRGVLPASARRFEMAWTKSTEETGNELRRQWDNFAIGRYTAALELRYGESGKRAAATLSFWVFPWLVILTAAAVITILLLLFLLWMRWYARVVIKRHTQGGNS